MAYYTTVSPPLTSPAVRQGIFSILCQNSITGAFYLARKQDEARHRDMLEDLVVHALSGDVKGRAERAVQLLHLPLSEVEEVWFDDCLIRGKASQLQGAPDTVMMRRVALGRSGQGQADLARLSGRRVDGANWDDVKRNLTATMG